LKLLVLALAAATALALAACSGDEGAATSTGPIAIEQRVVTEEDAPGSKEDPVETPQTAASAEEFVERLGDAFINPTPEEIQEFETGSFVRAYNATRFIGDEHSRSAPHIISLVMQFETEEDATRAAEISHQDSIRPCPETCASQAEEFDVADIPEATGTHRFATAESIEATGDTEATPFDEYEVDFADGAFAYRVTLRGPPGEVTEDEAEEIAQALYERVQGAPAAD
jgi:hypothetical protein